MVRTEGQFSCFLQETGGLPPPALSLPFTPGLLRVPGLRMVEEKCTTGTGVPICTWRRGWGPLLGCSGSFGLQYQTILGAYIPLDKGFHTWDPQCFPSYYHDYRACNPFSPLFFPSFDLSSRNCFLCSPGHSAPPSPGHLWQTHTGTHGLYYEGSLKEREKKKIKKSQV